MTTTLATLALLLLLLTVALACTDERTSDLERQEQPYPTYTTVPTHGFTPTAEFSNRPDNTHSSPPTVAAGQPPQLEDPGLRDITADQHQQLDQLIADLRGNPKILAECAVEADHPVPQPGSDGEAQWYGIAAIKYSTCASSKATGVDLTPRGN